VTWQFLIDRAAAFDIAAVESPLGWIENCCPACGGGQARLVARRRVVWGYTACHRQTSVTACTVLHRAHTPLQVWFWAMIETTSCPRVRVITNLKTWRQGTHDGVSSEHLQAYLDDTFGFNRRRTPLAAFRTLLGLGSA
jgi:hypothetical protein